jgi:hypothetical protein
MNNFMRDEPTHINAYGCNVSINERHTSWLATMYLHIKNIGVIFVYLHLQQTHKTSYIIIIYFDGVHGISPIFFEILAHVVFTKDVARWFLMAI